MVSRDELIDRCWSGRIVGDDVINRCISLLRTFAAASGGFRIETISGAGYRLVEEAMGAKSRRTARPWMLGGAAAVIVAAAVGGALLFQHNRTIEAPVLVEVQPLKAGADDRPALALGQGLASSIEDHLAGSGTPVEIVDGGSRRDVSLAVRGTSISDHGELRASLELVDAPSGEVIWARNVERPLSELDDLQDQMSLQIGRVLHCAYAEGRRPYFDSDREFARLSLAHCDHLGGGAQEAVRLDSQIVQRAPRFARGWSEYAIDSAFAADELPPLLQVAGEHRAVALARHALALDPHQGLAYTAIGVAMNGIAPWAELERLARRAIAADPKSPEAHNWHSGLLAGMGRLQSGLDEARLSYQYDHFLPGKVDQLVRINIASGNLDDAQDEIAQGRRDFPGNPWWDRDAVLLGLAGRSPAQALALLSAGKVRMDAPRQRALAAFLRWRITPGAASRAAAISAIDTTPADRDLMSDEVDLLAVLGEMDKAYALAARLPASTSPDPRWFMPGLAKFRADARFMPLAARFGLAQIWLTTGLWPDFCTQETSVQSCKAKAAAAAAGHRGVASGHA